MTTNIDPAEEGQLDPNGESSVIRELRQKEKELKAQLKAASAANEEALATARAQVKRESQASQLMSNAGFKGLADIFAAEIDGDLSAENAAEWLKTRGLEAAPESSESTESTPSSVEEVADLGSQIASANQDLSDQNFTKQIDELEQNVHSLSAFTEGLAKIGNG